MLSPTERIAIVSDEAAADFGEAVRICLPLGIRAYELRKLGAERLPFVAPEVVAAVREQVQAHGLTILGISPGFAKIAADDEQIERELGDGLDAALRLAAALAVRRMTIFTYRRTTRDAPIPDRAVDNVRRFQARCRQEGVQLLLENSAQCWGDTGSHLAALARAAGVQVTWDPANAAAAGEQAYPQGYAAVRDLVAHVHFKNWQPGRGHVYLNDGVVDLAGQVRALVAAGYPGFYCIESHRWSDPLATETNMQQLVALLQAV